MADFEPFKPLGGEDDEAAARAMFAQLGRRRAVPGSAMEDFFKDQAAERHRKAAEERLNRTADRLDAESEARRKEAESKRIMGEWEAGQKNILDWERDQRAREKLRSDIEQGKSSNILRGAQTKEAETRTEGLREDIGAKRDWRVQQQDQAIKRNADNIWNAGVQGLQAGIPSLLTKDNADFLEHAGQIKFGPAFKLPRLPDGSLDPQQTKNLLQTMTNAKGEPSTTYAKGIRDLEKPTSEFQGELQAWQQARAQGDEEGAKWHGRRLAKMTAGTVDNAKAEVLRGYAEDNDIEGFNKQLDQWNRKPSSTKAVGAAARAMPPATARQQLSDGLNTLGEIDRLQVQFEELMRSNALPPTGRLVVPLYDIIASLQFSNSNVQAFRANIKDVVAQYRKFITGKASNEKEMADLLQAVPNEYDDTTAFMKKLQEMRAKATRRIRSDLGVHLAYGIAPPPDLPPAFAPITVADQLKMWGNPDLTTESGIRVHHAGELEVGKQTEQAQRLRQGQQVGGPAEFRPKGSIGYSVEGPDLKAFYDSLPTQKMKDAFEQLTPDDQVEMMQRGGFR